MINILKNAPDADQNPLTATHPVYMYCVVLYYVLYVYCIVGYCTVLYVYCTMYCIVAYCIALYSAVPYFYCTMYCIVAYYTVHVLLLYRTVRVL